MKTKEGRAVPAVVASILLLTLACSAYAQTAASITTRDGKVLTDVKVLRHEGGELFLGYRDSEGMGASWFSADSLSDDARKSLGLPPSEENASYEAVLWHVALRAAQRAQASRDREHLEEQWQEEAVASLAGPDHEVSFTEPDGTPVTKDSASLTPEEKNLYVAQYITEQAAAWSNEADTRDVREEHWLREAFERRLREERWLHEALRSLEGPNHKVSFIGPDGKLITKDSSRLTPEERKLCIRQLLEASREEHSRGEAEGRKAREEHWRDEAVKHLDASNRVVSFIGPDGRVIRKYSSSLTTHEKTLYLQQYAEQQEVSAWKRQQRSTAETAATSSTARQTGTAQPQSSTTRQTGSQQQQPTTTAKPLTPSQGPSVTTRRPPSPPQVMSSTATTTTGVPHR